MPWTNKAMNGGSNETPCSSPAGESCAREYKHGHFYDGNGTAEAGSRQAGEGSQGLAMDQGHIRVSEIPAPDSGGDVSPMKAKVLKKEKQGSRAQLGKI